MEKNTQSIVTIVDVAKTRKHLPKSVSRRTDHSHGGFFGGIKSDSDGKDIQIMTWYADQTFHFQIRGYKKFKHYFFKSEADAQKILNWHRSL